MGRQIVKSTNWAYIAGFLDGDGSIMVQIKNRLSKSGLRIMFTICFYQDSRHKEPLEWIQSILGIGYLSDRKDNITELRINGYNQVERILKKLQPFIKFKAKQVKIVLRILSLISGRRITQITKSERLKIVQLIIKLRNENYYSSQRDDENKLKRLLDF
ncbi:LAGLIDADG family homing endonuclease [Candidatus Parcubacteria bacterium]|nr:LAGLIDADG family homing endonuclease [Patescibacteria group bacterium]MCG2693302.1 LAGLIDADG family homing endonuclease [Candidatus Parcubacteria bacterium]